MIIGASFINCFCYIYTITDNVDKQGCAEKIAEGSLRLDFGPTVGHEPQNKRPALVVSNYEFNRSTSMTIVCPITTTNNNFFLHEPLPENSETKGVVVMEQLRAIDLESRGAVRVERLSDTELRPILICLSSFFSPDGGMISL